MLKKIGVVLIILFLFGCTTPQEETEEVIPEVRNMKLTSSAFEDNGNIPAKYTCDGDNINPQLSISDVADGTETLVLIMDDPDIPEEIKQQRGIEVFDHWVLFNIPPNIAVIKENSVPAGAIQGRNGRGDNQHTGPCPPPQYEPTEHRYFFKLYALDIRLTLPEGSSKAEVEAAMGGHILEETQLVGRYDRKR